MKPKTMEKNPELNDIFWGFCVLGFFFIPIT